MVLKFSNFSLPPRKVYKFLFKDLKKSQKMNSTLRKSDSKMDSETKIKMDMRRMEHKERMMDLCEKEMEYEIAIMQRFKTKEELEHFYDIMAKTKALTTSAMAQPEDAAPPTKEVDKELYATERSRAYEAEMNNLRRDCKTALEIREVLIEKGIMSGTPAEKLCFLLQAARN